MSIEIIESRPLIAYQMLMAKHAATRGTLCGLARFYAGDVQKLCRVLCGSLSRAIFFRRWSCWYAMERDPHHCTLYFFTF
jgi:hypothetical protein